MGFEAVGGEKGERVGKRRALVGGGGRAGVAELGWVVCGRRLGRLEMRKGEKVREK